MPEFKWYLSDEVSWASQLTFMSFRLLICNAETHFNYLAEDLRVELRRRKDLAHKWAL